MAQEKIKQHKNKYPSEAIIQNETNLCSFSFLNHKKILKRVIMGHSHYEQIIQDEVDFWAFIAKFENMLKTACKPILPPPTELQKKEYIKNFNKRLFISIDIEVKSSDFSKTVLEKAEISSNFVYKLKQFMEIVLLYLDFKQKDKFQKLKKLRVFQKTLPVFSYKERILNRIENSQIIIIAGDTGCGKSTQIPQYLYEMGYKNIACSQPRRLACVSLSKRVAHEMLNDYGSLVGYQIRFEKSTTFKSQISFITEGLLLRQVAMESNLFDYDALILDEIHERNLNGDILLGIVKCLIKARSELKLILMSATINVDLFKNYFKDDNVSYIEIPGRLYPIKTLHMPPSVVDLQKSSSKVGSANRLDPQPFIQILSVIDKQYPKSEKGDLLIFVSGVQEINIVIDAANQYNEKYNHWLILPLHSGLSLVDQEKVFNYAPEGMRKCIVATNIAETSITIDGIRFVIDSGKVKEMIFDSFNKIQRLKEFWVSKSSAEQRKGRAGRTGPGVCYRIYSQKDFDNFEAYPIPEIHRVPLESILLQMVAMGLSNVRNFPFVEAPSTENIDDAITVLKRQEALTLNEKITPLGSALSALPVEISIGKMLLMSCVLKQLDHTLTFAAILSVQSPYTTRAFFDQKCELARAAFESDQGDAFSTANIFKEWLNLKRSRKENTKKWCNTIGIEEQRFYELTKLRNQFESILQSCKIIDIKNMEFMSSVEKSIRYGEVKLLRAMKRSQKMEVPIKRKIIKTDVQNSENFDNAYDIRDIDFRLKNDPNQLQILLKSADVKSHKDILILKLIIASGFYPKLAIPDEYNFCQNEMQQFFHTSAKNFVSLHPNSVLVKYWEQLKLNDLDVSQKPIYYSSRLQLSSAHQVLCYQNLLETTKSYLTNAIRMAAAPTLLLFSASIHTDAFITCIVCDSWLCLEFPEPGSGQELLLRSTKIRRKWRNLLSKKLNGFQGLMENEEVAIMDDDYDTDQCQLLEELMIFMNLNITYTIRRLLAADLKDLYLRDEEVKMENFIPNPFLRDYIVSKNLEIGGLNVTENVVYGCLKEPSWCKSMQDFIGDSNWTCWRCNKENTNLGITRIIHAKDCFLENTNVKKEKINFGVNSKGSSRDLKKFYCSTCKRELMLTNVDILRHKSKCIKIKGDS